MYITTAEWTLYNMGVHGSHYWRMSPLSGLIVLRSTSIVVQLLNGVQLFCNPMDSSLPDSSAHGISQTRILEWVVISISRGSSWPRDRTHISCITVGFFTIELPAQESSWFLWHLPIVPVREFHQPYLNSQSVLPENLLCLVKSEPLPNRNSVLWLRQTNEIDNCHTVWNAVCLSHTQKALGILGWSSKPDNAWNGSYKTSGSHPSNEEKEDTWNWKNT